MYDNGVGFRVMSQVIRPGTGRDGTVCYLRPAEMTNSFIPFVRFDKKGRSTTFCVARRQYSWYIYSVYLCCESG